MARRHMLIDLLEEKSDEVERHIRNGDLADERIPHVAQVYQKNGLIGSAEDTTGNLIRDCGDRARGIK